MKAAVYEKYGPPQVLRLEDVSRPKPADDELLIKLYASSLNTLDLVCMKGPWLLRPMIGGWLAPTHPILGCDIAGRVEEVGKNVTHFQPGDTVFGAREFGGPNRLGAFAQYVCVHERIVASKPANFSFEDAAAVPIAALTALQGLRDKGGIRPGQKVLVEGASGGVGTFAVQLAKAFGAEVTAVCSARNLRTAQSIGADHVVDYTQEDFTRSGQRYDLIFAANARHSLFDYMRALTPEGIYVMAGGRISESLQALLLGPLLSRLSRRKIISYVAKLNAKDLTLLKQFIEAGKVVSVIDRRYPLDNVREALSYLAQGHAQGKVVISIEHDEVS